MKIGRNEPCPCGSGKKYKKCCLAKDEAAARTPKQPVHAPPPPSPLELAQSKLWQEFEAARPARQPALFQRALAQGELLDAEYAFEMLCKIRDNQDRATFAEALDALHTQRPDLYQHDASYYLDWQIADVLATGKLDSLPSLGLALADTAGKDLDTFYLVVERLAYHGQLELIAQMMARAWPHVRISDGFVPGADDEFALRAMDLTLFARLEQNPNLDPEDPALVADLEAFAKIDRQQLSSLVALLKGTTERHWTLDDFAFKLPRRREDWYDEDEEEGDTDPAVTQLRDLTFTFLGTLHREQGISLAKGDLARSSIERYILERHAGELQPSEMLQRPKGRKMPSALRSRGPAHPLCPDRVTLDHFIAQMFGFMSTSYYEAAATMELVPAWISFLEERGLLTAEQRAAALAELRPLVGQAAPIWPDRTGDPAIAHNIEQAWKTHMLSEARAGRG